MLRFFSTLTILAIISGCDSRQKPVSGPPPLTSAPVPSSPPVPNAAAGAGATTLTLQAAHENVALTAKKLIALLDSVQDDASAADAAPKILQEGRELAEAMKQLKATVAALSLSGQDRQINEFYQQQAAQGEPPESGLINKIEVVVNSPQGPQLRNEINGVLDGMLEGGTSGTRRGLERVIEQKKLRR